MYILMVNINNVKIFCYMGCNNLRYTEMHFGKVSILELNQKEELIYFVLIEKL